MIIFELILNQYFYIFYYILNNIQNCTVKSAQWVHCQCRTQDVQCDTFSPLWRTYPSPTGAGVVTHRDSMCGCGGQCLLVAVLTALSVLRFLRCCSSGGPNVAAGGWHGLRWETGSMGDRLAGATQGPVSIQWRLSP